MMQRAAVFVLVGVLANSVAAHSQSLADVARQEAERRKSIGSQARIYTNDDLGTPSPTPSTPAGAAEKTTSTAAKPATGTEPKAQAAGEAGAPAPAEKPKPEPNPFRDEKHWRERSLQYRQRLEKLRADVAAIQSRVDELRATNQTPAVAADLKLAEQDLTKYRNQLRYIETEWAGIEQKAREANVPATWLQ
jgi:hypothetical protein